MEAFVSEFVKLLVSYSKETIARILGVSEEIEKLHKKLALIQSVLADAERRQLQGNALVRQWIDDLKDIMYDAEDIIEEYKAKAEKFIEEGSEPSLLVRCCSVLKLFGHAKSKNEIAEKIKDLNRRLDYINKEKEPFNFVVTQNKESKQIGISQITSPIEEPDIVGSAIEDATRNLVNLLIQENDNKKNILIYVIVGMGGIGKTTLAQKIYNNKCLLTNFNPVKQIWLCISKDNFDEIKILKKIIEGVKKEEKKIIKGVEVEEINERGELEDMLFKLVRGKRIFLVLDDVWNAQVWEDLLRKPLGGAAIGSRVLVTTRDARVAMQIGAVFQHNVDKLSDEDGWSLLCKKVLKDDKVEELHALKDKGIEIVKKCDGLPIAINAVAGVLRQRELVISEWDKILKNPTWSLTCEQSVFYLSYEDLPSYLKQCFLYLSLFPQNSYLSRHEIIHLWIAEGFIETKDDSMLEETANDYWNELIHRNLLQSFSSSNYVKMHDLLRDFAQNLAQCESFCGDVGALNKIVSKTKKKVRRWCVHGVNKFSFSAINGNTSLRTFIARDQDFLELSDDDFALLKRTRIIDLEASHLERLPSSFANFIYLRYLNLSSSKIKELPESIKHLRNLQFLSLHACKDLQTLPKTIGFLTNLRYLNICHTKVDKLPKEMVELRQLHTLLGLTLSDCNKHDKGTWCTLEDVKHFKELKAFSLRNLERTNSAAEAREAALADKTHLTGLGLNCTKVEETYNEENSRTMEEVYEELCPPTCLERLHVDGYYGRKLPSWLTRPSSIMNVRNLTLQDFPYCEGLPPFLQLPQLAELNLSKLGLKKVGLEFFLPNLDIVFHHSFPKLEILSFKHLENWEEWEEWDEDEEDHNLKTKIMLLPRLQTLNVEECPKLRYLPHILLNHATALRELFINDATKLEVVEKLHHIKTLQISRCPNLKRVANMLSLNTVNVGACENLTDMEHLAELQHLTLFDKNGESVPDPWQFPKLHHVSIVSSNFSMLLRCRMDDEEWPKIRDIPNFEVQTPYGLFIKYTKSPISYNTNMDSIKSKNKSLPEQVNSSLHPHPLVLLPSITYGCDKCGRGGEGWSFRCEDCEYDLHPNCAFPELEENSSVAEGEAHSDI